MSHDDVIVANALFWAAVCRLLTPVASWIALLFRRCDDKANRADEPRGAG